MLRVSRKRLAFVLVMVTGVGLVSEAALWIACASSDDVDRLLSTDRRPAGIPATLPDPRLGVRGNPAHPEHDAHGYRNPAVPEHAEIVALGDSQTYGSGVAPDEAWPRRLADLTGHSTYGIAHGAWGPAHGLLVWDQVADLEPDVVIEALYWGNDLFDVFDMVWARGVLPELGSAAADLGDRLAELEEEEPLAGRALRITGALHAAARSREGLRRSKLFGLYRRLRGEIARRRRTADDEWRLECARTRRDRNGEVFEARGLRTVFTPRYRLVGLDRKDARIVAAHRAALEALRRLESRAGESGSRFVVALVPTKEAAFSGIVADPTPAFRRMVTQERAWNDETAAWLTANGIDYVDLRPALAASIANGVNPYFESRDGHPNATGHEIIARTLAARLK